MSKALEWTVARICNGLAVHTCAHTHKLNQLKASAAVVDSQRLTETQLAKFNKARLDKLAVR